MRTLTFLTFLLLAASSAQAAEQNAVDPYYDSSEAASDRNDLTTPGARLKTQPGLRECTTDADCTVIEGVCAGDLEPVNVNRAEAKEKGNRRAGELANCAAVTPLDPNFRMRGAACIENECAISKRRL